MIASFLLVKPSGQFGAHRPADLAPERRDPPLARARLDFSEEYLTAAIEGCSKTAILTSIDDEPAFLNADMIADVMAGNNIPAD